VAEELGIRRKRLYVWKDRYAELGEAGPGRRRGEWLAARKRIAELERKLGRQELELDFFAEALQRIGVGGTRSAR
jgi:transposase-like protein